MRDTYIAYYGDRHTDIYSLVVDGEIIETHKFATHNKGNSADSIVGKTIEAMLSRAGLDLRYADPMTFKTEQDNCFCELIKKGKLTDVFN